MHTTTRRRDATTLVEVLVAIFVMALGLLTLLTLFPLGALSMGQAIRDDRTAHAAANAAAIAEARNIRQDPNVIRAFDNQSRAGSASQVPPPDPSGPSYPVYVDPLGFQLGQRQLGNVSYGGKNYGCPRVAPTFVSGAADIARWFGSLDDMEFLKSGPAGTPVTVQIGTAARLERTNQYSWCYLVSRPRSSLPSVADVAVVVYSGRPTQLPLGEHPYGPVAFDRTSNFVDVPYTGDKPPIRKGSWILDATMVAPMGGGANGRQLQAEPHGYFYRVVGVTDASGVLRLELQTPPRASSMARNGQPYGVLLVLEDAVEVFEKGPGWQP
jgi:hypothetical protein